MPRRSGLAGVQSSASSEPGADDSIRQRMHIYGGETELNNVRQGSRHRADRLSRRRQDHPAQPHSVRAARQEIRRHRQRIRRDRHRQRPRRRRRRGSVRDEQRLHLLHRARRPRAHHRRADAAQGQVRRHHRRDHRARRSGAGRADLLHGRERRPQGQARRRGDGRRCQMAAGPAQGRAGGEEPDRVRRRHPAQQDRSGHARRSCARSRRASAASTLMPRCTAPSAAQIALPEVLGRNAFDLDRILEIEPEFLEGDGHAHAPRSPS